MSRERINAHVAPLRPRFTVASMTQLCSNFRLLKKNRFPRKRHCLLSSLLGPVWPNLPHFEASLDASSVRSDVTSSIKILSPPWRHPRGKLMIPLVNSHTNTTRIGWHLLEIGPRFTPGLPAGRQETCFLRAASSSTRCASSCCVRSSSCRNRSSST